MTTAGAPETNYTVNAVARVVSARGTDYAVTVQAPRDGLGLERIEFRSPLPTADGLVLSVAEVPPTAILPGGVQALRVFQLKTNAPAAARSAVLYLWPPPGAEKVYGLVDGGWKPLSTESVDAAGGKLLRAASDRLPSSVALGAR